MDDTTRKALETLMNAFGTVEHGEAYLTGNHPAIVYHSFEIVSDWLAKTRP